LWASPCLSRESVDQAKKWQGRLSRKQSIALPKVVNARGLLTIKPIRKPLDEEVGSSPCVDWTTPPGGGASGIAAGTGCLRY